MNWVLRSILLSCLISLSCFAWAEKLTVVYPDVKAPYDIIFQKINEGIAEEFNGEITQIKLPKNFTPSTVAQSIKSDKVIALGKRGMMVAKQVYQTQPVIVGALPIKPNGISGVSLMADPNILFDSLNELAPKVKIVTVLYTSASAWIMNVAKEQAIKHDLQLNSIKVDNIRTAVKAYSEIFEHDNLENMAIWLPLDPITANDKVIVPTILEKAWENKMVVFSSKPTHAKRGALFSAMPNNKMLGHQLARMINTVNYKKRPSTVNPLNEIKLAVNLRTAAHLGYNYNVNEKSKFSLTFPK
ncbi:MAG: ABC transporter substrate binding protein [Thalassotalea sp.]